MDVAESHGWSTWNLFNGNARRGMWMMGEGTSLDEWDGDVGHCQKEEYSKATLR
jgi:hypothetical protein